MRLLLARGYASTTVDAIAAESEVGVRTVYDIFGSKSGILRGIIESFANIPREDFEARVHDLGADPDAQLELAIRFVVDYFSKAEPFLALLRTNAYAEPALADAMRAGEALRRVSQRAMVVNWVNRGALRLELNASTAADILWALTSPDLYRMLVQERRWSRASYRTWLRRSLRELLFSPRSNSDALAGAARRSDS